MAEWKEYKIGDLCRIRHGFAFKGMFFSDAPTCNILMTPGNFKIGGGFKIDKPKYYNGDIPNEYILHEDDLIVTMTDLSKSGDTLGYSALVPEIEGLTLLHNQRIGRVTDINEKLILKHYLYWVMRTEYYQKYIVNHCSGSTVKHTSPKSIESYQFLLPPLVEQNAIAKILDSLDDKIEINRRINANLEEQASALFKSWFVDFEPFKDGKFIDSELGKIPEGWRIGKVKEIVRILSGFAFKSDIFSETGQYRLITIKNVQDGHIDCNGATKITGLPCKMPDYCLLNEKDILLSLTGNVGRVCIVNQQDLLLNQRVAKLVPKDNQNRLFTYSMFRQDLFKTMLIQLARGTAQLNLSPIETAEMNIIIPSSDVLNDFAKVGNRLFDGILQYQKENLLLDELRDALLPKLMSGELIKYTL